MTKFRLDKQPVCWACGREIEDFLFCREIRGLWKHKGVIIFVAGIVGVAASIDLEMLPVAVPHSEKTQIGGPCESPQQMREGVYRLYGNFKKANRPGRLTIRTPSGSSCFIKLETALGGSRVMSLRVHGGSTLDADVPLGTFALKYAAGAMWYGERDLFGKDTALFKAKDTCTFEKES